MDSSGDPKVAFLEELKLQAAAPKNAKLNTLITERDLDKLVRWQMLQFPRQDQTPLTVSKPNSPITRARVLAALIKVALPSDHIACFRGVGDDRLTTDARTIPIWARAYVAAAIEERWWSPQMRVQANQSASWALAVAILTRMPVETNAETVQPSGAKYPERGAITGIILEAEGLPLERAMGPRILDEDGNVVYPLPNTTNDFDKLLDKGLMDYCESEAQAQKRAGRNPLVIRALDLIAPAHHDIIISRADADRIREENKRGRFLQRWAVSVISRSR